MILEQVFLFSFYMMQTVESGTQLRTDNHSDDKGISLLLWVYLDLEKK